MTAPLLELRGISKSFSGFRVLEGVDFEVGHAEVHSPQCTQSSMSS